ncbi:ABC transporter permease [Kitasatospora indigofera]|uniref:ABC transporter permease n=1 Tax=Kitasatospora indigofera TaxID=67307 RepID=UPI003638716C
MAEAEPTGFPVSRIRGRDLYSEALAGLLQRPARTLLTMLGTVLGVGAFTAILGLTATTSGQISKDFTVLTATTVTVNDPGDAAAAAASQRIADDFPADADQVVDRLNGVVRAGRTWPVFGTPASVATVTSPSPDQVRQLPVVAATPGYLHVLEPTLRSGTLFDAFHDERHLRVAVLGNAAAAQLGVSNLANQPAVFVNGVAYTVIGIIDDVQRAPDALLDVLIPASTARAEYGAPAAQPAMLIRTRPGAAQLVAHQVPLALRPDNPQLLQSVPPPDPHGLRDQVGGSLGDLFLVLAAITLLIGAVGIANTTLVAVLERTGEIGLRRSLGARSRHIAAQFLSETTVIGTLGGLVGTALGLSVVLGVAVANHWTAVLDPATTLLAPLIGTVTGLVAGAYPALRAARIEPLEALRR